MAVCEFNEYIEEISVRRTQDEYRSMMDTLERKLKDEDSNLEMVKLSLLNSAKFAWGKMGVLLSDAPSTDDLYKCANESITERRRKLDHSLYVFLQKHFRLAPGNFREQFDCCWNKCLTHSFAKHTNNLQIKVTDAIPTAMAPIAGAMAPIAGAYVSIALASTLLYVGQLMNIVSEAWQEYLQGIRTIIESAWKEENCE